MKKISIYHCEDCPYLRTVCGRLVDVYSCSNAYVIGTDKYREILRSDNMSEDDPIRIPEWCPLKDDT